MIIQSYLILPATGQLPPLSDSLSQLPGRCEVLPAENRDALILVTETETVDEQRDLERQLESLSGVQCASLIAGWTE